MAMLLPTPQYQARPTILTHLLHTKEVAPSVVCEAEYWEKYYEDSDHHYEWNNGYLEEKGVSDKLTLFSYEWFFELLRNYLRVTQVGQLVALETGFRLALPHKVTIRKPDLGVILKSNPVPWNDTDNSFRGICDLCVEALSDSTKQEMERDTKIKFKEYAQIGVPEYYILYAHGEPQQFYRLTSAGTYVPIQPVSGDLICSTVLPGFQFRVSDLQRQPSPEEMSEDRVYQGFMLPALQAEKQARQWVEQLLTQEKEARQVAEVQARQAEFQSHQAEVRAQQEWQARQFAELQVQQEREARQAVEARLQQLEAELVKLRQQQ